MDMLCVLIGAGLGVLVALTWDTNMWIGCTVGGIIIFLTIMCMIRAVVRKWRDTIYPEDNPYFLRCDWWGLGK